MVNVSDMRDHIKGDLAIFGTDSDAQIENAIRSALRQYRGKRFWFLKKTAPLSLAVSSSSTELPKDFAAPGEFEITVNGMRRGDDDGFEFLSFARLKSDFWNLDPLPLDVPQACAVVNNTLHFSCRANVQYSLLITYYRKDADLPQAGETSIWFDEGYDAIRSLAQFIFKRDAQGFTAGEEDGALATYYLNNLNDQHIAHEAGK